MRINLKQVLSSVGVAIALAPGFALAQWEVRPAPPSWNLPQTPAPSAPQPAPMVEATPRAQSSQMAAQDASLNEAITCSAALQLATMAAPNWANERGVTNVTNVWLQRVFALAEPQGVTGDKVPGLVEAEMQRQIDGAASDPAILSRRAFACASRQP